MTTSKKAAKAVWTTAVADNKLLLKHVHKVDKHLRKEQHPRKINANGTEGGEK
jgi:hypothetical protein